ncbi:Cobalt-zinc-cadmium resistance protein CzcA; Cation efflux system protein CusA [hydrothermal vent metagenome]|uniref:Cobalt-zinc-cadmium resistance protein CzcA Cation efflux system protein CusA n=1 Tax=hydrothermal vent metagenome TaxID=652676 RepID=A0A3B1APU2_9ZZZZ
MLTYIIKSVIQFRFSIVFIVVMATLYSFYAIQSAPLDALPDISDPQIVIYAKWDRSPEQLENKITKPIIQKLMASNLIHSVRATSHLGYSFIYVIYQDHNQRALIRQFVVNEISAIRATLPSDASITLGPNASSMGWIYQYAIVDHTQTRDLRELRLLNDTIIKPNLQSVAGIAEIASVGGLERQIELKIFPPLLTQTGVNLRTVINALTTALQQVGGRSIELTNRDYQLRAVVNIQDLDKLEYLIIARNTNGEAILLRDIGYFQVNYDVRRGIVDLDGEGEVVGAIVIMEQAQNVIAVSNAFEKKLQELKSTLPKGIEIINTYNRSTLIWATLKNFASALAYEILVVILVIFWALRHGRAALAPVLIVLLSCLYTLMSLSFFGQTINLLSLAGLAIAIGEMADASIVIVENCSIELAKQKQQNYRAKLDTIIRASAKMMRPLLFSLLIIVASFIPVFFLDAREARLFDPLALSKTFAMVFSTVLTLILLPIIIAWVFKGNNITRATKPDTGIVKLYSVMLKATIRHRYIFLLVSLMMLIFSVIIMNGFKKDYMPEMEEGSILYMPTTLPGLPTREAGWILQEIDKKIKAFPEVKRVFGKLGRADTATDPAPLTMIETTILLHPQPTWREGMSKKKLIEEMNQALQLIGYVNSWTQPIAGRVIMQDTGIQSPIGIKVKGMDIAVIETISKNIENILRNFKHSKSVIAERISQGYFLDVNNDLQKMAQHNVTVDEALLTVRYGIGGDNILMLTQDDNTRVPLSLQYSPEYIDTLEKIKNLSVVSSYHRNNTVALSTIADIKIKKMPEMIRNDNGLLSAYIYITTNGISATDYVPTAKRYLQERLSLPQGYFLEWTGTHQYTEQVQARLLWIVPITLIIMFSLLLMTFKSISISVMVLLSAPFALIGGVLLQWAQAYAMTTAVIIGYIAVLAVAIQTGIIMIEFIRDALTKRTTQQSFIDAVTVGSIARLRPKLMTVATTVLGLLPIIMITGTGMDVTRPIAAPSVGGMISSTIYVLFLIPCLFVIGDDFQEFINNRS